MKKYIITETNEFGAYFLDDNVYTKITIKDSAANVLIDPSTVSISITCPHSTALIVNAPMVRASVGVYSYDYNIPSTICYGVYKMKIATTSSDTLTYLNFVVFPWDVLSRIREISGAIQQADISDYKLALIAWTAYEETLREIYELYTNESPLSDPTSGVYLDGVNTRFQVRNYPIADVGGDDIVAGNNSASIHESDLDFYYNDSIGDMYGGIIRVVDAKSGVVALTDLSGNPLPADTRALKITYYSESPTYNQDLMREAVAYLAAHKMAIAFKALDKATLSDLGSNRASDYNRFLRKYEELIERIGFPAIGSGR
jgi:hypothetical protein